MHEVADIVARVRQEGAVRWPSVRVPQATLERHVAIWQRDSQSARCASPALHEVYIASGCADDAPGAITAFEHDFFASARPALKRFDLDSDTIDEAVQRTRVRLFVPRDSELVAPIVLYAGMGRLGGLVRVTMVREAYHLRPKVATRTSTGDPVSSWIPDRDLVRRQHRALLAAGVVHALHQLDPDARLVLRLHYVAGLSATEIARMRNVHRATVGRWLGGIRRRLTRELCAYVRAHAPDLAASEQRLEDLVASQLDVSLCRVLRESP